jgi:hypothetical protein
MKPIEILEQARSCNICIDAKLSSLERLYFLIKHITRSDDIEPLIIKASALEKEINAKIDELIEMRVSAHVLIASLPLEEQAVLEEYYINCLDWDKVAEKIHFSIRKVYNLRKSALSLINSCAESAV